MYKSSAKTVDKLPAHFTNAVFDEDTGQTSLNLYQLVVVFGFG